MTQRLGFTLGVMLVISGIQSSALAQPSDFRVETDVFSDGEKKPVQRTLTLFSGGIGYDIPRGDPSEITVVYPAQQRIVLLDAVRQVQTSIDLKLLTAFLESARKQAAGTGLAVFLRGAALVNVDAATKTVTVGDPQLRYEATLQQPDDESMAAQYAAFADALAQLNSWRSESVPPFARISLNAAIAEQKALPKEVIRKTRIGDQEVVVSCRLLTNWRLAPEDQTRVAEIGKMLTSFQSVSHGDFFQ